MQPLLMQKGRDEADKVVDVVDPERMILKSYPVSY